MFLTKETVRSLFDIITTMAININAPKNILLMPLFILLVIVAIPFALFFSLIRLPFAKRRINKLPEILLNDWQSRGKYIYIGLNSDFALSDYVKKNIITQYKKHIVWDEWDAEHNEWNQSEPDTSHRVTTFWQDIGGDFDGDPMVIIATYSPNDTVISESHNFYQFWKQNDSDLVMYDGSEVSIEEAQSKIKKIVDDSLKRRKAF